MIKASEFMRTYLKNDNFYQVQDGELVVNKKGQTVRLDLSPFKHVREGFYPARRIIGVVLFGEVFIVPNTPNNYFRLKEILFMRNELATIPYLRGEKPIERNPILDQIL